MVIYMFSILRSGENWRGLAPGSGSGDGLQQTYMNWRSPSPAGSSSSIELLVDHCVSGAKPSAAKIFLGQKISKLGLSMGASHICL